jgi:hypothetical protein
MQLLYLPQKGVNSHLFLPPEHEVPEGTHRVMGFNFPGLAALGTNNAQDSVRDGDFVAYALVATVVSLAPTKAFGLMFYPGHGGQQRQLWEQIVHGSNVCGTGDNPAYLPSPYLFAKGDTITCEVSNITKNGAVYAAADIYIALWGVLPNG